MDPQQTERAKMTPKHRLASLGLMVSATMLAILVGVGLLRWLAPELLRAPDDLTLVATDVAVPPFFDLVFDPKAMGADKFLLNDPLTRSRGRPRLPPLFPLGPHDLLGFRNESIPNAVEVLVIGDSQTYGNNVPYRQAWPSRMGVSLSERRDVPVSVYQMAVGGWGAAQYLSMSQRVGAFLPQVVVLAFYSGNDPTETLRDVRDIPHWRQHFGLQDTALPKLPRWDRSAWTASFDDGVVTTFTPTARLLSNQAHPAIDVGWELMASVMQQVASAVTAVGAQLVVTVIPTKELVYADKVAATGALAPPPEHAQLLASERTRIRAFEQKAAAIPGVRYVDLVGPLQAAALGATPLYPENDNGHPVAAGYQLMADVLAPTVGEMLPAPVRGLYRVRVDSGAILPGLVTEAGLYVFSNAQLARKSGWPGDIEALPLLPKRADLTLPRLGVIRAADPVRFGPKRH